MATVAQSTQALVQKTHNLRQRVIGTLFLVIAVAIYVLFAKSVTPEAVTTFGLNLGKGAAVELPDWQMPTFATVSILAAVTAGLGAFQLARGFGKYSNAMVGIVTLLFIFSLLAWATGSADKSLNLIGLLKTTLLKSVPLTIGALSGLLCERAGVVNIAIEGMLLAGAMMASFIGSITQNLWLGVVAAMLTGAVLAAIHAVLSIRYKVDQVISGTVINIFSVGITSFISARVLQVHNDTWNTPGTFKAIQIPFLSQIPVIGPIFFDSNIFTYATFILLIVVHIGLFYTRWGLRVRAVGEHPKAADTLGIDVNRTRYINVILGGLMAGFGGAYFTVGSVGGFDEVMTAGRGFIGLAAMIFGNYTPFGAFGSALIFGFADSLQTRLAILSVPIPSQFLLMAPYIATMLALAGLVGRVIAPAADGQPYEKQ
jgi:simple sugar transport system permease protein